MIREIKYRGLTNDNEWVYGVPLEIVEEPYKEYTKMNIKDELGNYKVIAVKTETIGQYINITDLGKEIYEGDVVAHVHYAYMGHGNVDEVEDIVVIEDIRKLPLLWGGGDLSMTVIGNKYLNPELVV